MAEDWLDFEQPLAELYERLEEVTALGLGEEIAHMQQSIQQVRERVYSNLTAWQRVQLARHPRRPYTQDYIDRIAADFVELRGDRAFADDPAIIAGFGRIDERPFCIIGHQKGRDTREKLRRNFGMAHPEGYRKALRVMEMAARFDVPILTLVDTPAAYPGLGAEERGQAEAIARNLRNMAMLPVPIVCVVTGEGGSGGALGVAVGDRVLMQEFAVYSVIPPEGCAAILWRDGSRGPEAAEVLRMTAQDQLRLGVIEEIVPEPAGAAHLDWDEAARLLKKAVLASFRKLEAKPAVDLIGERVKRFGRIGAYGTGDP